MGAGQEVKWWRWEDSNLRHGAYECKTINFRKGLIIGLVSPFTLIINTLMALQCSYTFQYFLCVWIQKSTILEQ